MRSCTGATVGVGLGGEDGAGLQRIARRKLGEGAGEREAPAHEPLPFGLEARPGAAPLKLLGKDERQERAEDVAADRGIPGMVARVGDQRLLTLLQRPLVGRPRLSHRNN